jgi:GntR family transcriptional regulator
MAEQLDADTGTPALGVVRRYYDRRRNLFEFSVSTHPAGRYSVTSTLRRLTPVQAG